MDRKLTLAGAASKMNACVKFLSEKYKAEGYEVQAIDIEDNGNKGVLLQMRDAAANTAGGWLKKLSGLETCATVKLIKERTALSAEVLAGKWLDKVAAGAVSMVVLWPLFITASIGAIKQKTMLDNLWNETVRFLNENDSAKAAPRKLTAKPKAKAVSKTKAKTVVKKK